MLNKKPTLKEKTDTELIQIVKTGSLKAAAAKHELKARGIPYKEDEDE